MNETKTAAVEIVKDEAPAPAPHAIVRVGQTTALGALSKADFAQRLQVLKDGAERIRTIQREVLEKDVDYGEIPGTKKPTLLKPGAEKLTLIFELAPTFDIVTTYGDGRDAPDISVTVKAHMHVGDSLGPIISEGAGAANSWESRYRYRQAQRACPKCGVDGTVKRSQYPPRNRPGAEPGWYCHAKMGGCGGQFEYDDPSVLGQSVGQKENPDPFDLLNTLTKMAVKRAFVDGTLRATATSGYFTQDVEDGQEPPAEERKPAGEAAPIGNAAKSGEKLGANIDDMAPVDMVAEIIELSGRVAAKQSLDQKEAIRRFSFGGGTKDGRRAFDVPSVDIDRQWLAYTLQALRNGVPPSSTTASPKGGA